MINIHKLTKVYKTKEVKFTALSNVDLTIRKGESVAIMGKSGAGKTTLMNIIGCLDTFDSGEYLLNGKSMKGLSDSKLAQARNSQIGFVMQDFALVNHKSVLFNVMLPMYFDKTPSRKMKHIAMATIDKVGIVDQAKKKVSQLSGGQKQRVAIARAIVKQPELILADEPTGALDSATGQAIMETLMQLNKKGITLVIVTHDEDIAAYCQRKIILADGTIHTDEQYGNL